MFLHYINPVIKKRKVLFGFCVYILVKGEFEVVTQPQLFLL